MKANKNEKRKSKGFNIAFWALVIISAVCSLIEEEGHGAIWGVLVLLLVTAAIIGAVYAIVKYVRSHALKKAASNGDSRAAFEQELRAVRERRRRADEARDEIRTYSAENYNAQEYERARRLEMLDSFLKNGLIEKEEYRIMKQRYESR